MCIYDEASMYQMDRTSELLRRSEDEVNKWVWLQTNHVLFFCYYLLGEVAAAENRSSQDSTQLEFSGDEETLIVRMYNLVGERQI